MGIVYAKELWSGRDGNDDGKVRSYTRNFRVQTDTKAEDAATLSLLLADIPSFPVNGDSHPNDAFATARRAKFSITNPLHWNVSIEYSTEQETEETPEEHPIEISWDGEELTRAIVKDLDGKAIVNSAGDPFETQEIDEVQLSPTIKARAEFVPLWVKDYTNVVNDSGIIVDGLEFEKGHARIKKIPISTVKKTTKYSYREITIKIYIDGKGHQLELLNQGFRERDAIASTKRKAILNVHDKTPIQKPALLDADGIAIADPKPTNAVYLDFRTRNEKDFTVLPGIEAVV